MDWPGQAEIQGRLRMDKEGGLCEDLFGQAAGRIRIGSGGTISIYGG